MGYTWTEWTIQADSQQDRLRRSFELILGHAIVPHGELWVTGDCAAAAVWIPPGPQPELWQAFDELEPRLMELAGDRAQANAAAEAETSRLRLREAHWFLASMGTRPERQREGLGSAVLAPVLEGASVAQLATASVQSVTFYRALGFEIEGELDVSGGGPHVWSMVRRQPSG